MRTVSLIIPCYNAEEQLEVCLQSILEQTYNDIQLVFVDDGSNSATKNVFSHFRSELERKFPEVILCEHIANKGQAAAINSALPLCVGKYIMWADADDVLLPDNVRKKAEYLDAHPEFNLVRANAVIKNLLNGKEAVELALPEDKHADSIFIRLITGETYANNGCYMVRAEALKKHYPHLRIPFSRNFYNMQLLLPVAADTPCGYIDEVLTECRIHGKNMSCSMKFLIRGLTHIREREYIYREVLNHCEVDREENMRLIRDVMDELRKSYIHGDRYNYRVAGADKN